MLDLVDNDTEIDSNTATSGTNKPTKFTEEQAREHLAQITGKRPPVRDLAATWGWSKSTVARFLSQADGTSAALSHDGQMPTAHERREMQIRAGEDFDSKFPPETSAELVDRMVAEQKISLAGPTDETERQYYWEIPHQRAIECRALPDGAVEIWQDGAPGSIQVAAGNAVQLARHVLYAAGFPNIGIYSSHEGGGCVDIEDGDLARNIKP